MQIPLIAPLDESVVSSSSLTSATNRIWKWGPILLLALIYAFTRFRRAVKISILHLHWRTADQSSSESSQLLTADGEFFTSDDEDGDAEDEVSSSSSEEDEAEARDDLASTSCDNLAGFYDDRSEQKRKFKIRRKRSLNGCNVFSLGDLVNGKSVVRFWDGLGLGLGLDCSSSSSSVSILDLERDVKIGAFPGRIPEALASSAVVFTASDGRDGKVGVNSWDVRVRRRVPAVKAEWSLRAAGPAVGMKAVGVEKVYVRDGVSRNGNGRVWDVRNAKSPLENVTSCDGERWWNTNAVSQTEEEE